MFGILVILFIVVPAIEIYLLIKLGAIIGGFNTLLLVIATGIVGAALAKSQGLAILNTIQNKLSQGQLPTDQIINGLLVFGGGLLLLTPGILTDILGLSMVFPGTRFLWVASAKKWFEHAVKTGSVQFRSYHYSRHEGGFNQDIFGRKNQPLDENTFEAEYEKKENDGQQ